MHGVREYWVVNARTLETRVHREPGLQGFADVIPVAAATPLVSLLVPSLTIRLADLQLD